MFGGMSRTSALALMAGAAIAMSGYAANAADLGDVSLKDPLPETLSYHGVTLYGTVDVGVALTRAMAVPESGAFYTGLRLHLRLLLANKSVSTPYQQRHGAIQDRREDRRE